MTVVMAEHAPATFSQTQSSLTQEQRDRIARQKELALAKRNAKGSFNSNNNFSTGGISSPFAAASRTPTVPEVLPKVRLSLPSVQSSTVWRPFVSPSAGPRPPGRRAFTPPSRTIDLDKYSYGKENASGLVQEQINSVNLEDGNIYGEDNLRVSSDGLGQCLGKIRKRKSDSNTQQASNGFEAEEDEGWRSVRKRSLPGSIYGNVGNDSNVVSHGKSKKAPAKKYIKKKLSLSKQQQKVLKAIAAGNSVFITGSAGVGKSFLLHEAIETLKKLYGSDSVFVTASTGLAASALGGTTLHSFSGIGLGNGDKKELAKKVGTKRDARKRWNDCKALIIDEISMIDGQLFDKLEFVARTVRGNLGKNKIFGGIQLVVTGDFFQLPPVTPENPDKYFAFQADCWNKCFELQVELTQVFRQSDEEFVGMLNEIRKGNCSAESEAKLKACNRPVEVDNTGILLTKLYPRKMDVGKENGQKLRSLNQETFSFLAKDDGKTEFALRQLEAVRAEKELHLSVGAQVMLIKNVDAAAGLVNGARGVVVRFTSIDELEEGKDLAKKLSPSGRWPVVLFACDGVERLVKPESWSVLDGNTEVAKRSQIPLVLAWALSVHKCQGMTLDRVEIDLSKSFEYGMVYVALSRVKCLDGLKLTGFNSSLIKVHPSVVQFYEELKTGDL